MDETLRQQRLDIIKEVFIETGEYEEVYNEPHDNFIIVECEHGHRYKVDYSLDGLGAKIRRGCPFCKGYKQKTLKECSYNQNLLSLETAIRMIPEMQMLNDYEFFDLEGNEIPVSELTICSSRPLEIRLKEGKKDVLHIIGRNHPIDDIGKLFFSGTVSIRNSIKFIVEEYINIGNCDNNTYYFDDNHGLYTKEMIEIAQETGLPYICMVDTDMKNKYCSDKNIILNESNLAIRNKYMGKEPYKIKVYKYKPKDHIREKRENKEQILLNGLIQETERLIAEKNNIELRLKEIVQETENISCKKRKKDIKQLRGEIEDSLTRPVKVVEVIKVKSLLTWCLQPENQELGNIIINQFLPRKNKLSLSEIPFDSDEVIYIKSSHGTTFETTPRTITHDKKVLPKLPRGTSYPELFIFYYMESIYPEAIHRGKAYGTVEYDITIPEKKACIEYNGSAFHKGKYARPEVDASKLELCKKKGVKYIRIEDDGDTFVPKIKDWLVTIKYEESRKQEQLMLLCKRIVKKYFHSNKQGISLEEIEKKIRLYY